MGRAVKFGLSTIRAIIQEAGDTPVLVEDADGKLVPMSNWEAVVMRQFQKARMGDNDSFRSLVEIGFGKVGLASGEAEANPYMNLSREELAEMRRQAETVPVIPEEFRGAINVEFGPADDTGRSQAQLVSLLPPDRPSILPAAQMAPESHSGHDPGLPGKQNIEEEWEMGHSFDPGF